MLPVNVRALLLAALIAAGGAVQADEPPMVFNQLSVQHGLSQSTVMDVHQDSQGFIWIATENGLNRYDGYEFKLYSRDRGNPSGLGSDYIWAIEEDADQQLWFATEGGGVATWDPVTDGFRSFRHDPDNPESLSSDSVRNLIVDRRGRIWAATLNSGLNLIDTVTGSVTRYLHDAEGDSSIGSDALFGLLEDRGGNIWIGTDRGLNRYVAELDAFERVESLDGLRVLSLAEDSRGDIWVGTFESGLYRLDAESGTHTAYRHDPADPRSLSSDDVRAIFEDSDKRLWIGTANGLNLFNRIESDFQRYESGTDYAQTLAGDYVMSISQDASGLLWVGTRTAGANRWNPRSWSMGHNSQSWLKDAYVASFADDGQGFLWVGTIGAGLSRVDLTNGDRVTIEEIASNPEALGDTRFMSLLVDRHGALWMGTMTGGLSRLDKNGVIETFRHDPGDSSTISAAGIMALYEDSTGSIWAGTFGGGVSLFDRESGAFIRVFDTAGSDDSLKTVRATAIVEDANGHLWIGTDNRGLILLDRHRGVIGQYVHDPSDQTTPASNNVYSMYLDERRRLWVGTAGGGLDRVVGTSHEPDAITFENLSQHDGLPNNVVYGIQQDNAGHLWLSTNHGLARFDPDSREIKAFHEIHGLQSEEFNFGAHHRMQDGRLVFGGPRGFNAFHPMRLQESSIEPRVALTGLEVLNEPVDSRARVSTLTGYELKHSDDVVTFEFAALDFTDPSRNNYSYKLEGFDEDFVDIGNLRRVTYTNLDPGEYIFRVRAASADSVWNHNGIALPIKVHAAPWQTAWAYAAYLVALALIVFAVLRHQAQRLRREEEYARRLSSEVEARTDELNQRNRELREASEAKSNFLARMSHEIRTPMNGVIGMTELLRGTNLTPKQAQYTKTISRSAKALLQIINDILDLSKIEAGRFELEALPLNLSELVDDTIALLGRQASEKGVELVGFVDPSLSLDLIGDPFRLRQILINLVGNAIKFTEDGEVKISAVCDSRSDEWVTVNIEVSDTGIGMNDEVVTKIFDAFSQADESTTRRFGGTGLGLSICRQLVELMDGAMFVSSTPNIGSTFTCVIPLAVSPLQTDRQHVDLTGVNVVVASPLRSLRDMIARSIAVHDAQVSQVESTDELGRLLRAYSEYTGAIVVDCDAMDTEAIAEVLNASATGKAARLLLVSDPASIDEGELLRPDSADLLIAKPVRWPVLFDVLRRLADRPGATIEMPDNVPSRRISDLEGRILVVEDNEVNQLVAEGMLRGLGCQVTLATDGRAGVAKATTEDFDLVLMDAQMPGMDGFEATRLIRRWEDGSRRVPIVGVTAHASGEGRQACIDAGMDDYLGKPYVLDDLVEVIHKWTNQSSRTFETASRHASTIADAPSGRESNIYSLDAAILDGIRSLQSDDRPELLDRIFAAYLDGSTRLMDELAQAAVSNSLARIRAVAHALKSSSGNIGATEFSRLASELEKACDRGDEARALALTQDLQANYSRVVNAVQESLEAESA